MFGLSLDSDLSLELTLAANPSREEADTSAPLVAATTIGFRNVVLGHVDFGS